MDPVFHNPWILCFVPQATQLKVLSDGTVLHHARKGDTNQYFGGWKKMNMITGRYRSFFMALLLS